MRLNSIILSTSILLTSSLYAGEDTGSGGQSEDGGSGVLVGEGGNGSQSGDGGSGISGESGGTGISGITTKTGLFQAIRDRFDLRCLFGYHCDRIANKEGR